MASHTPKENVTRQNIPQDPRNPKPHLNSGYEGAPSTDYTIPSCGIADVDVSLFNLFNETIGFDVFQQKTTSGLRNLNKPYVIMATGERFAVAKRLHPPRDKKKVLILPAIAIRRTSIEQNSQDMSSRGINQFTGNLVIKRKLSREDRDYQNLVNKLGLSNLQGVLDGMPTSTRRSGDFADDIEILEGGLLGNKLSGNNIYEIISIPQPQFYTANYEVTFWTTHTQHMNYLIEKFMSSFLPQTRGHKLQTDKGYWFVSHVEDSFQSGDNFDQFEGEERLIRYTFTVNVKAFILAPNTGTDQVSVRRELSSPNIVFELQQVGGEILPKGVLDRPPLKDSTHDGFTLTDIQENPVTKQTPTTEQRYKVKKVVINPKTGKRTIRYVSILGSDQKQGETVYTASDVKTLWEFVSSPK